MTVPQHFWQVCHNRKLVAVLMGDNMASFFNRVMNTRAAWTPGHRVWQRPDWPHPRGAAVKVWPVHVLILWHGKGGGAVQVPPLC